MPVQPGRHRAGGPYSVEGIQNDIALVAEKLERSLHQLFGKHGGMPVFLHFSFGSDTPPGKHPLFELLGAYVNAGGIALFLEGSFAEYLDKFPAIFQIGAGWAFPAAPRRVLAVIVILLPEDLALPDHFIINKELADQVMTGYVVGKQGLHVDQDPPPILGDPDTFLKDAK